MYQVFYKKKFILLTDVIEEEKDFLVFPIKNVKFKLEWFLKLPYSMVVSTSIM